MTEVSTLHLGIYAFCWLILSQLSDVALKFTSLTLNLIMSSSILHYFYYHSHSMNAYFLRTEK